MSRNRTLLAIIAVGIVTLILTIFARPKPLPATAPALPPPPPPVQGRLPVEGRTYAIDVASSDGHQVHPPAMLTVRSGAKISVSGWALDSRTLAPASAVGIVVDKRPGQLATSYHQSRPDVATALGNADAQSSGFNTVVDLGNLARGRHTITFGTVGEDRQIIMLPTAVQILIR